MNEIWRPDFIYHIRKREMMEARGEQYTKPELPQFLTDYIVVGPTSSDLQTQTGTEIRNIQASGAIYKLAWFTQQPTKLCHSKMFIVRDAK